MQICTPSHPTKTRVNRVFGANWRQNPQSRFMLGVVAMGCCEWWWWLRSVGFCGGCWALVVRSGGSDERWGGGRAQANEKREAEPNGNQSASPRRAAGPISYVPLMAVTESYCSIGSIQLYWLEYGSVDIRERVSLYSLLSVLLNYCQWWWFLVDIGAGNGFTWVGRNTHQDGILRGGEVCNEEAGVPWW